MVDILTCRSLVAGCARGSLMVTRQSISFWGGVDPATGNIIDPRHELFEQSIAGRVLAFPYGKGSAAAPLVLLELAKQRTMPAAVINVETDPLLAAGPIISRHFYGIAIPVVVVAPETFDQLRSGDAAVVDGESRQITIGADP